VTASPSHDELRVRGIDPSWSHMLSVPGHDGSVRRWHLLDRPAEPIPSRGVTVLCLHGNPTWSYLWSRLLVELDPAHRVIAPDHLSMGYSENTGPRRYRQRVDDVADLLTALGVDEPVWVVGHDWGGAIALGLAVLHPDRVCGLLLANTGIAVPRGRSAPRLIRLAASRGAHQLVTRRTSLFVRGTPLLPGRRLERGQRRALRAPYRRASDRYGVAGFVADVPFADDHPSHADLQTVADGLGGLDLPVRLVWGARDPVFDDDFAEDLLRRVPDAKLHRFPDVGHLSVLEASIAPILEAAILEAAILETSILETSGSETGSSSDADHQNTLSTAATPARADPLPLWSRIVERADSRRLAVTDAATGETIDAAGFALRVGGYAAALTRLGVSRGDRVALLVPASIGMLAALYALWRIGAVAVVADKGLGLRGLGRALRSSRPAFVLGTRRTTVASRMLRWAPRARVIRVDELDGADVRLDRLPLVAPAPDDPAVVVFTSGATGPAKGVRYTHRQLCHQRDALQDLYAITEEDSLVAAFAPFAVFGPALGITTGLVDADVSAPATLTATALEEACVRAAATLVFASPAALANVVRTAQRSSGSATPSSLPAFSGVRLVLSAGAPVPLRLLESLADLCPGADIRTPYGMTEILPVADVSLMERHAAGSGAGVCVGRPVAGCRVRIAPLTGGDAALPPDVCGEVVVHASWMSAGYDRLWHTEHASRPNVAGEVWHRTGDLGHLDAAGNLWIEGRVAHLIETARGPVTPVPVEVAAEAVPEVVRAAAVGVGPRGLAQVVVVIEIAESLQRSEPREGPASAALSGAIRAAVTSTPVAAVWVTEHLPVDIRHNAKIDRTKLSRTMSRHLAGGSR
jgi:acyl-CoA synthetase (AMP-forming)/AMP-acid ligase II/pimeloyl-ACP methyl ester carboxylesterase